MDRVKVFLRVKSEKKKSAFSFSEHSVLDASGIYDFDRVFCGESQAAVFDSISPLVDMALDGYDMTVFTYGQTGSGKTYTMEGTADSPGIIPLSIQRVFRRRIDCLAITAVEVYNEKVFDLLSESTVDVRETKSGVVLDGARVSRCLAEEEAARVFAQAARNRKTDSNGVNSRSSRSHMVFTMRVTKSMEGFAVESRITLVDLAGSEKISPERAADREQTKKKQKLSGRLQETGNINRSLLYLSRIINTLSSESRAAHVSYRDSKLTFILRDALAQGTNLAIIGTVELEDQAETKSTISFLSAAKKIKLSPRSAADEKTAEKLIAQIRHLAEKNMALKSQIKSLAEDKNSLQIDRALQTVEAQLVQMQSMAARAEELQRRVAGLGDKLEAVKESNRAIGHGMFDKLLRARVGELDAIDVNIDASTCRPDF